jgi:putative component of membrane protein insertase Oxa1/YidC/SpoIIIJ protein YidD
MFTIKTILFIVLNLSIAQQSFAQQNENRKWEKTQVQYSIPIEDSEHKLDLKFMKSSDYVVKPLLNLYRITISDADGSVCSFEPSCSEFLLEAIDKTNFLEGLLLFSDRFQRDANVFNRGEYALTKNKRLSDSVERYFLR